MTTETLKPGHTLGPWQLCDNSAHTGTIATVYYCPRGFMEIWSENCPKSQEESEANARLIAAAPELLAALKHALSIADPYATNREFRADRKIAAKAEGRE